MEFSTVWSAILDHILVPVIIAFGAALILVLKHIFDKVAKSMVARNEMSEMEKKTNIRKELIAMIATNVEAAVGSNMQLSDAMKKGGQKLTQEQIESLNNTAKKLVINSLPPSLTETDGVLLEIIGGKERLDSIIDAMMEKYVYDYKLKKIQGESNITQTTEKKDTKNKIPTRPIRK